MVLNQNTSMLPLLMLVMPIIIITLKVTAVHFVQGLQAEECLHSHSGSTEGDSGGLLEDGVGLPVWLYCDALSVGRRWPGLYKHVTMNCHVCFVELCNSYSVHPRARGVRAVRAYRRKNSTVIVLP